MRICIPEPLEVAGHCLPRPAELGLRERNMRRTPGCSYSRVWSHGCRTNTLGQYARVIATRGAW